MDFFPQRPVDTPMRPWVITEKDGQVKTANWTRMEVLTEAAHILQHYFLERNLSKFKPL